MKDRELQVPCALVANIQRYSLHDGGGIRTVAFLKGCPFHCPWCCNPEDISYEPEEMLRPALCIHCSCRPGQACLCPASACPTGAKEIVGTIYTALDLARACARDRIFFEESGGGVTLSGGEALSPCYQEFSLAFFEEAKRLGLHTAVETTLSMEVGDLDALSEVVDVWLVDFKISDELSSREVCGVSPKLRDANVRSLLERGSNVVARMPIIPGYTDTRESVLGNIDRMVELGLRRADVLPFHQLGEAKYQNLGLTYHLSGARRFLDEDAGWVVEGLRKSGIDATLHGL